MSNKPAANPPVRSPCVGVCTLDANDICEGCYRSLTEIAAWAGMDNEEKRDVVTLSWQRAKQAGKLL